MRVVLPRSEWGRGKRLPPCCIYCGRPAGGYVAKSVQYRTGGFEDAGGEAGADGLLFGLAKALTVGNAPARTTRLRVHLPVCDRHRRAWLVWSWFRMSLDHDALVLSGVAEEFARAVERWRAGSGGGPTPHGDPPN